MRSQDLKLAENHSIQKDESHEHLPVAFYFYAMHYHRMTIVRNQSLKTPPY